MSTGAGFVSVPIVPTFAGMSKEFSDRLVKPAQKAGKQAGDAITSGLDAAVDGLQRQVKASEANLDKFDKAYRKSYGEQEVQKDKVAAATANLTAAEEKYNAALKAGKTGTSEFAKVAAAKAKLTGETNKLREAEGNANAAQKKHQDQLSDYVSTLGKLENAQKDANAEVGKSKGVFGDLGGAMGGLKDKAAGMGGPMGEIVGGFSDLKGLGPVALVAGIASAATGAATAFGKFNEDLAQSRVDIQNSFGLSADAARNMQGEIADALGSGMGGYEDTATAVMAISQTLGDEVAHMGGMTASQLADDFMAFNQTFERSAEETASTVDVLLNSGLVENAQEGIDLLTAGMQKVPAAMQDEVFDATNEYSKFFANMGFNGSQTMAMLTRAAQDGQYAIDKTGDAVAEFSKLAVDPAKAEAFESIGLSAGGMASAVAGGGDSAASALRDTAQALLDIQDPGERAAKAIELFGTPIEDLGVDQIPGFLESLTAGESGMGDFAGAAQTMADNTSKTFSGFFTSMKGHVQGWAIDATLAVNEWAGNLVSSVLDSNFAQAVGDLFSTVSSIITTAVGGWWDYISWVWGGLGDLAGNIAGMYDKYVGYMQDKAAELFQPLVDKFTWAKDTIRAAWEELTSAFTGGDWGYGALASMIGVDKAQWVIDKVASIKPAWEEFKAAIFGKDDGYGALATIVGVDQAKWILDQVAIVRDGLLGFRDRLVEGFGQVRDILEPVFLWVQEFVGGQLAAVFDSLKDTLGSLWESVKAIGGAFSGMFDGLIAAGKSVWDALKPVVELLGNILMPILKIVGGLIGGVVVAAIFAFIGALRVVAEVIEVLAKVIQWLVENVLAPLLGMIADLAGFLIEHLVGAISWVIQKIAEFGNFLLENFWPAVQMVMEWVGQKFTELWDALSWAWENVIKPVFNAILEIAQITLGVLATLIIAPLLIAWNVLSTGIQWAWENVIKPAWDALMVFATETLWPILQQVFQWVQDGFTMLGEAMLWVWESLIQPVFTFVADAALWLWESVLMPIFDAIRAGWQFMADGFMWVWENILRPTFDMALLGAQTLWDGLNVIFGWVQAAWQALADAMRWVVDNIIRPAFDAFAAGMQWLYDSVVVPVAAWIGDRWTDMGNVLNRVKDFVVDTVFGGLGRGLDTVRGWFETAVEAIGQIWDRIREKTRAPVEFVVNTVYNGGIRKAWNAVSGLVGLDDLPEIAFATGGILPGYTPGRDPYTFIEPRTGMSIGLSGGEAVLRPEATRALGPDWVNRVNAAARTGGQSAVENTLKRSHFANGGIIHLGNFAGGGFTNLAGALSAIQESHAKFVSKFFPGAFSLTSASRSEPGSFHDFGSQAATDWQAGDGQFATQMPTPASKALARAIATNFPNTAELIHWPLDGWQNINDGAPYDYGAGTNAGHGNHVHWASRSPLQFDGDDIILTDVAGGGGSWFDPVSAAKGLWDSAIGGIGEWTGGNGSMFDRLPGAMLETLAGKAWDFVAEKAKALANVFTGGSGEGAERWRGTASQALKRMGYGDEYLDAMIRQIEIESGGNPNAINNWDSNAAQGTPSGGLLQVIEPTYRDVRNRNPEAFEGLPDNRFDPLTNLTAGVGAVKRDWGGPGGRWPTTGGYADGGIIDLANHTRLFDTGGVWESGTAGVNLSGQNEYVFTNKSMRSFEAATGDLSIAAGELRMAAQGQDAGYAALAEIMGEGMAKQTIDIVAGFGEVLDPESEAGMTARGAARRFIDLDLEFIPFQASATAMLDAEESLAKSRERAAGHIEEIAAKEKALADSQKALDDLLKDEGGLSKDQQRKLDDAQKDVDEAKADAEKAEGDEKRASAAEKVADAEEKLSRVREDLEEDGAKSAEKRAEDIEKATSQVAKSEAELAAARKAQAKDLDNVVLPSTVGGMFPQLMQAADLAANHALPQVAGALLNVAGMATPAGLTLGMVFDVLKIGISVIRTVVGEIKKLIEKIHQAKMAARESIVTAFTTLAEYAGLLVEMQTNVGKLQQEIVRGLNEQRVAEFNLRVAQQDRLVAEAEGMLSVAEARLALDKEIAKGARAAQLKLMGLYEDWDSYLAYEALVSQGALDAWSDVAISALFAYESARAKALQGELSARVQQINAEFELAKATRQNARNQFDLLRAQERLIQMSAKVAGIDLEGATGSQSVAQILMEIAQAQAAADKNVLGKIGAAVGANGTYANEYRGQQAQVASLKVALEAVVKETGVAFDQRKMDQVLSLMSQTAFRGGDPMAVLRAQWPELAAAEAALRTSKALDPIFEIRDKQTELGREVEDFTSEVDLFGKVQPLEEVIKGLDYTIKGLDQSSAAWAKDNEELRAEYLRAARANQNAAGELGVNWKLDDAYATPGVRDRITKEVTINLSGSEMYTADQVDELLAEVTSGSGISVTVNRSASTVAAARRGVIG